MGTPRAAAGTVLFREAVRSSRRWQTYALRVLVTGLFLSIVVYTWNRMLAADFDIARAGEWGREMFEGWAGLQMILAVLLAPILVAMGVIEERDEGTLELLALTRLSSAQILFGKALSRLLLMLTFVLAGLPVLATIGTLGGVADYEIVSTTVGTGLVVLVLGAVGGHVALYASNAITAALGAWVYAAGAMFVCLFPYALLARRTDARPWDLSPVFAMQAEGWIGLAPVLAYLAPLALIVWVSVPVFRIATSTGGLYGEDLLSQEFWVLERFKRHAWAAFFAWLGLGVATTWLIPALLRQLQAPPAHEWIQLNGWVMGAATIYLFTVLFLLAVRMVHDVVQSRAEQQRLVDELGEDRAWRGTTERVRAWVARRDGAVWGNPVAWRELSTGAHSVARLGNKVGLGLLVLFVFVGWSCEGANDDELNLTMGGLALAAGGLMTVLAATASMVDERRTGSLSLLLSTTMAPWRIVWGKFVAVLAHGVPLLIPGALLFTAGVLQHWDDSYRWAYEVWDPYGYCGANDIHRGSVPIKLLWSAAWASSLGLWLIALCLVVALRVRPPRLAWVLNIGLVGAWLLGPSIVEEMLIDAEWAVFVRELLLPITIDGFGNPMCGVSGAFVASTGLHLGLAALALFWMTRALRRWGRD